MDTISGRRVAGFMVLALAMLIGALAIGSILSGQPPIDDATATRNAQASPGQPSGLAATPTVAPTAPLASAMSSASPTASAAATTAPTPTFRAPTVTQRPAEPGPSIQVPPPIR